MDGLAREARELLTFNSVPRSAPATTTNGRVCVSDPARDLQRRVGGIPRAEKDLEPWIPLPRKGRQVRVRIVVEAAQRLEDRKRAGGGAREIPNPTARFREAKVAADILAIQKEIEVAQIAARASSNAGINGAPSPSPHLPESGLFDRGSHGRTEQRVELAGDEPGEGKASAGCE